MQWKRHSLSNIDKIDLTATCVICGSVPLLVWRTGESYIQYVCWPGRRGVLVQFSGQALQVWDEQKGNCAICQEPMTRGGRLHAMNHGYSSETAVLDHDHKTNFMRGFVHQRCNKLLADSKESPDILAKAVAYLRRFALPIS